MASRRLGEATGFCFSQVGSGALEAAFVFRVESLVGRFEFVQGPSVKHFERTHREIQKFLQHLDFTHPHSLLASFFASFLAELLSKCHGEIFDFQ
jgi:hypothetical protein